MDLGNFHYWTALGSGLPAPGDFFQPCSPHQGWYPQICMSPTPCSVQTTSGLGNPYRRASTFSIDASIVGARAAWTKADPQNELRPRNSPSLRAPFPRRAAGLCGHPGSAPRATPNHRPSATLGNALSLGSFFPLFLGGLSAGWGVRGFGGHSHIGGAGFVGAFWRRRGRRRGGGLDHHDRERGAVVGVGGKSG